MKYYKLAVTLRLQRNTSAVGAEYMDCAHDVEFRSVRGREVGVCAAEIETPSAVYVDARASVGGTVFR